MSIRYKRVYKIIIGTGDSALIIDGFKDAPLQVRFAVDQTPSNNLAYAEITLFGLSRETRERIKTSQEPIQLIAGYASDYGTIFSGQIFTVESSREGVSTYTRLFCRSGGGAKNAVLAVGKGTPQKDIIRKVAETLFKPVRFVGNFDSLPVATGGKTIARNSIQALNELAKAFSFTWIIANGELIITKDGAATNDVYTYSLRNGLIGTPSITMLGVDATVLLSPNIRLSDKFKIKSELGQFSFNEVNIKNYPQTLGAGIQKVNSIVHTGDFYNGAWETKLEGVNV